MFNHEVLGGHREVVWASGWKAVGEGVPYRKGACYRVSRSMFVLFAHFLDDMPSPPTHARTLLFPHQRHRLVHPSQHLPSYIANNPFPLSPFHPLLTSTLPPNLHVRRAVQADFAVLGESRITNPAYERPMKEEPKSRAQGEELAKFAKEKGVYVYTAVTGR